MKKILSLALILSICVVMMLTLPVSARSSENDDVLIVTANGSNPTRIKVGTEFVYRVGLYAGESKLINGQVKMLYDVDHVSLVPVVSDDEEEEVYSFPPTVRNAGLTYYSGNAGMVRYNFSRVTGVALFNDPDKLFARFRFKATAPGTVDISYKIEYMMDVNERSLVYDSVPDPEVGFYTAVTIEPTVGCIGDADNDDRITVLDATLMQSIAAGRNHAFDDKKADVTDDGAVSLKDALAVRRYLAHKTTPYAVGEWMFASEQ